MILSKNTKYFLLSIMATTMLIVASPALAFSFSVSVSPSSGIVDQGSSINLIITAAVVDASNPEDVEFSISGLPNYTQATYSSGVCSPNCSTLVNIATNINSNTTPAGKYSLIVRGNAVTTQSIATTTSYTLTVSDTTIGAIAEKTWLQTDSSATETGFNFMGSVSTSTATNVVNKNGGEVELLPVGAMPNIGYAVDTNGNIQKTINKGSAWNIIKSRGVTSY